jgi:succinate dehydrogenase flavin-adding protein (antitoxin of CptAB toxin-antitoxin module)
LGPIGLTGAALAPAANYADFTNQHSYEGLLNQSDKNIVAVNNYFNARYKGENKGNLYKWVTDQREIPFSSTRTAQTKVLDKLAQLGCR